MLINIVVGMACGCVVWMLQALAYQRGYRKAMQEWLHVNDLHKYAFASYEAAIESYQAALKDKDASIAVLKEATKW